jgi:hypothetical protein
MTELDWKDGLELARAMVGQQLLFTTSRVEVPSKPYQLRLDVLNANLRRADPESQ